MPLEFSKQFWEHLRQDLKQKAPTQTGSPSRQHGAIVPARSNGHHAFPGHRELVSLSHRGPYANSLKGGNLKTMVVC